MLREYLTNKWVLGAIGFLIMLSVACVFWYRYDTAHDTQELVEAKEMLRQRVTSKETKTDTETTDLTPTDSTGVTGEKPSSPEHPQIGEMVDGRIYLGTDPPSPELLAAFGVHPPSQDEIISPYGFGPYPELPEGFGPITWPRKSANSELRIRVKIKLLKQGVPVEGSIMENGLVYPIIKGIRYVIWGESDGKQYLRRSLGHPEDGDYMRRIEKEKKARDESITAADFPDIQLIPFEEAGIDPYIFLDLPK